MVDGAEGEGDMEHKRAEGDEVEDTGISQGEYDFYYVRNSIFDGLKGRTAPRGTRLVLQGVVREVECFSPTIQLV